MDSKAWQAQNLAAIHARLQAVKDKSDGVLFFEPAGVHFIVVSKQESRLRLRLLEQVKPRTSLTQSWMNLEDPLYLSAFYTQMAMLGLIWANPVQRACIIGFGGGRIPMLLHHSFPQAVIDCADIDPQMVAVATNFFGVQFDHRLRLTIKDGREFLARRAPQPPYNFILIDVFLGNGYTPYRLFTREFYQLCHRHLSADGVVIVNILDNDPFYAEKIKTIQSVFEHVYVAKTAGNSVLFGCAGPLQSKAWLVKQATAIQAQHQFTFPFVRYAANLRLEADLNALLPHLAQATILTDAAPPASYFDYLPSFDTAFGTVDPDAFCPCGSGRYFNQCHGHPPAA